MTAEVATEAAGRTEALRSFCEREYPGLVRYAWRLVGDEQLARDLTQEAFVRLFGRWTAVTEPRAYLYLTATNLARRQWRRAATERSALRRAFARPQPVLPPEPGVRDAVDRLPRRWRDVVLLYYFADLPVPEVARQLGEPEGTVRRRLTEARALLATSLGGTDA